MQQLGNSGQNVHLRWPALQSVTLIKKKSNRMKYITHLHNFVHVKNTMKTNN